MRDLLFEDAFLSEVVKESARRAGIDTYIYAQAVSDRLALGALRYGEGTFLSVGRDNLREVLEETPDVAAYGLLELQVLNRAPHMPEGVHHHLFEASVHAAIADWHARQARLARRF